MASFIYLTSVNSGSWVLKSATNSYETVLTTHLQDNIQLQDNEDSNMISVTQDKVSVGDDDAFTMERTANSASAVGKDFIIAGQKAGGNNAGGNLKLRPGAGAGSQSAVSGTINLQDGGGNDKIKIDTNTNTIDVSTQATNIALKSDASALKVKVSTTAILTIDSTNTREIIADVATITAGGTAALLLRPPEAP
jgi:hypothetical protein